MIRPRSKFGAVKTEIDGITFASKAEAKRYGELKLLQRAGLIRDLEVQPKFPLIINGVTVATYIADFAYFEGDARVVEDVKGVRTPVYILKRKLVEALYPGMKIVEIGKAGERAKVRAA